ncbi:MAG: hypothetical protein R6W82_01540 [bacterium]
MNGSWWVGTSLGYSSGGFELSQDVSALTAGFAGGWNLDRLGLSASVGIVSFRGSGLTYTGYGTQPGHMTGGSGSTGGGMMPGGTTTSAASVTGVGDLYLSGSYRLLGRPGSTIFRFSGSVKAPLADESEGLGTGEWDAGGQATLTLPAAGGFLTASGGYMVLGDPAGAEYRDPLSGRVSWFRPLGGHTRSLFLEVAAAQTIVEGLPGPVQAGVGYGVMGGDGKGWLAGLNIGLTEGAPDWSLSLSLMLSGS